MPLCQMEIENDVIYVHIFVCMTNITHIIIAIMVDIQMRKMPLS